MKVSILTAVYTAFLLCAAPAGAATLDFSGHDSFSGDGKDNPGPSQNDNDDHHNYSDISDWSSDDHGGKNNKSEDDDGHGKNGGFSTPDNPSWKNKDSWFDDKHNDHDRDDYRKDRHAPPLCATADLGHKWGDKDDKFGHRFSRYFWDICDKGKNGDPGHHHGRGCDPVDPAPLPGAFLMFLSALVLLIGFSCYKRTGWFAR